MSARSFESGDWEKLAIKAKFQPMQMAAICGISLRQLERTFGEAFRKSPTKWLREMRCRLVLNLISKGYTNKAIVEELHFGSESHLCHDFRKVHHQSPRKAALSAFKKSLVANEQ